MYELKTKQGWITIDKNKVVAACIKRKFFSRYHNIQVGMKNGITVYAEVAKADAASVYLDIKRFIGDEK